MAESISRYSRLGSSSGTFDSMMRNFGVVTVMNAKVYDVKYATSEDTTMTVDDICAEYESATPICELKTLKIANVSVEGPSKTVTGGQYGNTLIKFGKTARLEIQDALGNARALDALCGTVTEYDGSVDASGSKIIAFHNGEQFGGPKCVIGDTFFIEQSSGEQVKVKIIFYNFNPDSIFNLTQDAEGDATVFDMNGDLLTTTVKVGDKNGNAKDVGLFYSIIDAASVGE